MMTALAGNGEHVYEYRWNATLDSMPTCIQCGYEKREIEERKLYCSRVWGKEGYTKEEKKSEPFFKHDYEDVSRHGSPDYECRFCGCNRRSQAANLSCSKAEVKLKEEANTKERNEFHEYLEMKAKLDRWEYLRNKYEAKTKQTMSCD